MDEARPQQPLCWVGEALKNLSPAFEKPFFLPHDTLRFIICWFLTIKGENSTNNKKKIIGEIMIDLYIAFTNTSD